MYYIWDGLRGNEIRDRYNDLEMFDKEDEASSYIKKHIESGRQRFCFVKEYCAEPWAAEARLELEDGSALPPVWSNERWYRERVETIAAFCRVNETDKSKVNYFANRRDGARSKWTTTTPGRFLSKFFADILTGDDIQHWSEVHKERFDTTQNKLLRWATTPDEIQAVYQLPASFFSCMQHGVSRWGSEVGHPTRVYGAGDLSLAYITNNGKLIARALVWKEKNKVGRVYGNCTLLRTELRKEGIETQSDSDNYDTFEGARLLYIPYTGWGHTNKTFNSIVMPYVDGDCEATLCEDGFLRLVKPVKLEDGYLYGQYTCHDEKAVQVSRDMCNSCTNWINASYRTTEVHEQSRLSIPFRRFEGMCNSCRSKYAFYCDITYKWYPLNTEYNQIELYNEGRTYKACLERNSHVIFKSDLSGKYFYNTKALAAMFGKKFAAVDILTHGNKLSYDPVSGLFALKDDLVKNWNTNSINWDETILQESTHA